MSSALRVRGLTVEYGPVTAVSNVNIDVEAGECVALVGPNGAGKSSLIAAAIGLVAPTSGTIELNEHVVDGLPPHRRVRAGLAVVPEGRQVIGTLTVLENLEMGSYWHKGPSRAQYIDEVFDTFPRLAERRGQVASTMSGGEQQMLAIGRALMSRPRVVLMDEPTMGLAPVIVEDVLTAIRGIQSAGTSVLLVEQNARAALDVASRGYVMARGAILMEGDAEEVSDPDKLSEAYLS